ncbi:MAG: hypothetical protein Q8J96_01285 [Rhodocyclaceae bacterium]|nr:hypothetical protein [Rhodocyclaceae bacterium]
MDGRPTAAKHLLFDLAQLVKNRLVAITDSVTSLHTDKSAGRRYSFRRSIMSKAKTTDAGKRKQKKGSTPASGTYMATGGELHQVDAVAIILSGKGAFIAAAKTRQWDREKSVRTLV